MSFINKKIIRKSNIGLEPSEWMRAGTKGEDPSN